MYRACPYLRPDSAAMSHLAEARETLCNLLLRLVGLSVYGGGVVRLDMQWRPIALGA